MRNETRPVKAAQLSLFHPRQVTIRWEALPREIQQQSLRLLARLLREHCARSRGQGKVTEAGDE